MSFILDALKKSESDRQRRGTPGLGDIPEGSRSGHTPRWIAVLAVLLAVNALVLLGLWLRPVDDVALADRAPPSSPLAVGRESPDSTGSSFATLVSEARERQPPPVVQAETTAEEPSRRGPSRREPSSADARPAGGERQATPPPVRASRLRETTAPSSAPLPTFNELRARGTLQLPDLHLDIHVFGGKPADRFVFVNMNKYREQGRLAEGPVVKEISADGVVLEHQGTEFLLPRE
jgi:general secretion pathway protein B